MREKIKFKKIITQICNKAVVFTTALFLFLASCEEDSSAGVAPKNDSIVSTRIYNANYFLKDSGYTSVNVRSPMVEMYELIDTPYTVFPMGLEMNYFKKKSTKPGYLRASYAKFIELKGWYEAKGNVIIINEDGDSLKTQHLYWNQKTHKIFTPDTTHIVRTDGSILNSYNGMEASEDFKTFTFKNNNRGAIFVKD